MYFDELRVRMRSQGSEQEMSDLLTRLERPGIFVTLPRSASSEERLALALHVATMKAQGHAVTLSETIEHGEKTGDMHVTHYLTCAKCKGLK